MIVYIPDDQYVYLDNTTKSFLYDVKNKQNIYDADMANHYFLMGSEGFDCVDCDTPEVDNDAILKINKEGLKLSIKDGKDKVKVKIDEEGIEVK